jgi:hypothetical protein
MKGSTRIIGIVLSIIFFFVLVWSGAYFFHDVSPSAWWLDPALFTWIVLLSCTLAFFAIWWVYKP